MLLFHVEHRASFSNLKPQRSTWNIYIISLLSVLITNDHAVYRMKTAVLSIGLF